ncbi:MAG: terminase [Pseudomonadota bacterium]
MSSLEDVLALLTATPEKERETAIAAALKATADFAWIPNPGPQTAAYFSEADELLYGGQAGGGKSDLLLGLGLTAHERALILRRVKTDVEKVGGLGPRLVTILGSSEGYNAQQHIFKGFGREIELNGCEQEKDKERFKGRPHDLKGFDELADFLESQYLFIIGWNRTTTPGQRVRVVSSTNPPTTPEGQWIVRRWAAWLDPNHPNPAKDGELRWFITKGDEDIEVEGPGEYDVGRRLKVRAKSRTFIRSTLQDNPDLAKDGSYQANLDAMPEELRRAYSDGDFSVGLQDDDFQVFPIGWIEAAMQRWTSQRPPGVAMTATATDVAQGGKDFTVTASRYGGWYAPLDVVPGTDTKEGYQVTARVTRIRRDRCPAIIDVGGGYGADAVVSMTENGIAVFPYNGVLPSTAKSVDKQFAFKNKRAESHWRFREALNPEQEGGSVIALPPDPLLKADLAAVHFKNTRLGIQIEEKAAIKDRIGRSPDRGDAVIMCLGDGELAVAKIMRRARNNGQGPQVNLGHSKLKQGYR